MLLVPRVCDRSGVSMFKHPPISTVSPATSMSWNSALASWDLTTPGSTRGEMSAAQITAPRSLKIFTRSRWRMPLAAASVGLSRSNIEAMAGNQGAMVLHLVDRAVLAVTVGVEAVAAVGGDHLQRIPPCQFGVAQPFPGREVAVERWTVGIVRRVALEDFRHEFQLAARRLQPQAELFGELRRQRKRFRHVLAPSLGEPAHVHRRAELRFFGRHDEVSLAAKLPPGNVVGQIR